MKIPYPTKNRKGCNVHLTTPIKLLLATMALTFSGTLIYAQEKTKPGMAGFHGGINAGVLDNGYGPSLSFQYAFHPEKVVQTELSISFDSQKGEEFGSGDNYRSSALTLAAGIRLNIRPQKNWNPSIFLMPGLMMGSYESEDNSNTINQSNTGLSLQLGLSNTIHNKHMITIGLLSGANFDGLYFRYGFLF